MKKIVATFLWIIPIFLVACVGNRDLQTNNTVPINQSTKIKNNIVTPSTFPLSPLSTVTAISSPTKVIKSLKTINRGGPAGFNVRSGPGTIHPIIFQLSDGQTVNAYGVSLDGNWVEIEIPSQPNKVGWISVNFLEGGINGLTMVDDPQYYQPVLPPDKLSLSLHSSDEEIRSLFSDPFWTTIWIDGRLTIYSSNGSSNTLFSQGWLLRDGAGKIINSDVMTNPSVENSTIPVKTIWISDGNSVSQFDGKTGQLISNQTQKSWTNSPLELAGDLAGMVYVNNWNIWKDQPISIVREDTVGTRPALVIDLGDRRFWLDENSGLILQEQLFKTLDHNGSAISEITVTKIYYMVDFYRTYSVQII